MQGRSLVFNTTKAGAFAEQGKPDSNFAQIKWIWAQMDADFKIQIKESVEICVKRFSRPQGMNKKRQCEMYHLPPVA
jgi:hypothetical protein